MKTFLLLVTHLILSFAIVLNKFQQTNKTEISHIIENHTNFEVSLHFGRIWPTVRRQQHVSSMQSRVSFTFTFMGLGLLPCPLPSSQERLAPSSDLKLLKCQVCHIILQLHTSQNSFNKWTKILSLEIILFELKNNGEIWSRIYFETLSPFRYTC